MNSIQPPLNAKEKQQFIHDVIEDKLDYFRTEAIAGKLGLWLSKDPASAKSAEEKIEAQNDRVVHDLGGQPAPGVTAVKSGDTVSDPHPSLAARNAERQATQQDLQSAAKPPQQGRQR